MDIMKYNGYIIKKLENKNIYVVIGGGKLCYWSRDFNKCINFINKENADEKV